MLNFQSLSENMGIFFNIIGLIVIIADLAHFTAFLNAFQAIYVLILLKWYSSYS